MGCVDFRGLMMRRDESNLPAPLGARRGESGLGEGLSDGARNNRMVMGGLLVGGSGVGERLLWFGDDLTAAAPGL